MYEHKGKVPEFTDTLFSINISVLSITRERSTRNVDVTPTKESRGEEVGKGKAVMTRISIPRAPWPFGRDGSFRG